MYFQHRSTDIIKKHLAEQEGNYDFSHLTGLTANHAPFRSKSLPQHQVHHDPMAYDPQYASMTSNPNQPASPSRSNDYSHVNAGGGFGLGSSLGQHNALPGNDLGGSGGGGMRAQQTNQQIATSGHNRSPSLKVRRYSFLAGSRRGRGFSEIFNSTILSDHFAQYTNDRDDSGLGRDVLDDVDGSTPTSTISNHLHARRSVGGNPHGKDTSPDSGVSESMEDNSKLRSLSRRRTLPCIVDGQGGGASGHAKAVGHVAKEQTTAHSSEDLAARAVNPDTYIIENGIRKRVRAEVHQVQADKAMPPRLPREFRIDNSSPTREARARGSLPDLKNVTGVKPMSRVEAYRLSTERREELRRLQDLAERRRHGDVGVILGDVKDWCQERQLLVLVIAVNLSLATMFFHLLS
ncbi:hypothetical protein C0Q70_19555 [Pomacea canaliculata]|uniref:Uncharacterized protein n=1 Tax=Pomacea canaliculata TaxID=400727 RepID=A0A2T7NJN3_POMCA|nr:hypothetical protein C0Q70_19555 [Pomacea canaliculata]